MIIFVVSVALLTLCNLATFLLSLPSNLMAEKRDARRESSATNKTILLTVGDSSVEQKNAPYITKHVIVVFSDIRAVTMTVCWHYLLFQFSNFEFPNLAI
jgi:hypothetical protein